VSPRLSIVVYRIDMVAAYGMKAVFIDLNKFTREIFAKRVKLNIKIIGRIIVQIVRIFIVNF